MPRRMFIPAFALLVFVAAGLTAQQQAQMAVSADVVIALNVEEREPVGAAEAFSAGVGQLFAWTKVTGAANTTVEHVWRYQEHELVVPINIGGSPWRVWSTKNIPPEWTGQWTFEVRTADGSVVATTTFTVSGP